MSTFILIDADAISFLVCMLFVAATLLAMQTLHHELSFYGWWSGAFAIGGLRYFITYLVSVAGLHITVFILDLLFIAQSLLMLQGILVMQERQQPIWLILLIGLGLSLWGYVASSLSFSWALHDIPVLGFYAAVFLIAGITCMRKSSQSEISASIRYTSSSMFVLLGLFYLLVLLLNSETNLRWLFVTEQGLIVLLGVIIVFAILNRLQTELHKTAEIDRVSGAYTRHYFFRRVDDELKRAQRYHRPFSLALLKIDQFDTISQNLEKKQLDATLRQFHDNIHNALRDVDFIGLVAQGEFAIALPETDIEEARHVAERQLYRSKKIVFPGMDDSNHPVIYITVIKCEGSDNSENIYHRARKIIDDRVDDGIHPLFY